MKVVAIRNLDCSPPPGCLRRSVPSWRTSTPTRPRPGRWPRSRGPRKCPPCWPKPGPRPSASPPTGSRKPGHRTRGRTRDRGTPVTADIISATTALGLLAMCRIKLSVSFPLFPYQESARPAECDGKNGEERGCGRLAEGQGEEEVPVHPVLGHVLVVTWRRGKICKIFGSEKKKNTPCFARLCART